MLVFVLQEIPGLWLAVMTTVTRVTLGNLVIQLPVRKGKAQQEILKGTSLLLILAYPLFSRCDPETAWLGLIHESGLILFTSMIGRGGIAWYNSSYQALLLLLSAEGLTLYDSLGIKDRDKQTQMQKLYQHEILDTSLCSPALNSQCVCYELA